jgi:transcriptional regulator with XRE-family HTH domain
MLAMPSSARPTNPRTLIQRATARNAREVTHAIGREIRQAREDAGLSLSRVAEVAGISKGYAHALEAGEEHPSLAVLAKLTAALGSRLSVRLDAGAGPLIRDHIQAAMVTAMLSVLHRRWRRFVEVPVSRPVRGVIDLLLHDPDEPQLVASEAQSQLRRIEQQIRWSKAKAEALATGGATELAEALVSSHRGDARSEPVVSRLLLLRSTRATHEVVATYTDLLAAAYPAAHVDAAAELTGTAVWPGPALVWMDVWKGIGSLRHEPPRGIRLGR